MHTPPFVSILNTNSIQFFIFYSESIQAVWFDKALEFCLYPIFKAFKS